LQLAIALAQYLTCEKANPKKQIPSSAYLIIRRISYPATVVDYFAATSNQQRFLRHLFFLYQGFATNSSRHPFFLPCCHQKIWLAPISTDYISEWREFIKNYPYGNVYDWLQFIGAENKQGNITAQECNDIIRS
jgi:DNA polymerase-3 subunit delta'